VRVSPFLRYLLAFSLALTGAYFLGASPKTISGALTDFGRGGPPRLFASGHQVSIPSLYRSAVKAIVYVDASSRPATSNPYGEVTGTGFAIDTHGDIVTNAHVVSGASEVWIETSANQRLQATVVGIDPSSDLAVLHIGTNLPALTLSTSSSTVGDQVLAIGNPLGNRFSASSGIVSALGRTLRAPNGFSISGVIQTDAAIDHGSSGGPLLDASGQVIGITSAIAAEGSGIAYAIPASLIRHVTTGLIASGSVKHAWLGIVLEPLSPPLATLLHLSVSRGALVKTIVPGGPAAKAGLRASIKIAKIGKLRFPVGGDIITFANGTPVYTVDDLSGTINALAPGALLHLTLNRDGRTIHLSVRLGVRPASSVPASPKP
jgi:S1-C subfamily serine protease